MFNHLPRYRFCVMLIFTFIVMSIAIFISPYILGIEERSIINFHYNNGYTYLGIVFIILILSFIVKFFIYKKLYLKKVNRNYNLYNNSNPELFKKIDDLIRDCKTRHIDCVVKINNNFISVENREKSFCYYFNRNNYPNISPIEMGIFMKKIIKDYDKSSYKVTYKYMDPGDLAAWYGEYISIYFNFEVFKSWRD